jgi:hypothetical protein
MAIAAILRVHHLAGVGLRLAVVRARRFTRLMARLRVSRQSDGKNQSNDGTRVAYRKAFPLQVSNSRKWFVLPRRSIHI